MNKINNLKGFCKGFIAGVASTFVVYSGVNMMVKHFTPTQEFVDAKMQVAAAYDVESKDVKLYRYDLDDKIWEKAVNTEIFGDTNGIFPNSIFSTKINGQDEIIAVVVASYKPEAVRKLTIFGEKAETFNWDVTYDNERSVYRTVIYKDTNFNVKEVMSAINTEISK